MKNGKLSEGKKLANFKSNLLCLANIAFTSTLTGSSISLRPISCSEIAAFDGCVNLSRGLFAGRLFEKAGSDGRENVCSTAQEGAVIDFQLDLRGGPNREPCEGVCRCK